MDKHGFPFIIAVRDHDKAGILQAFAPARPRHRHRIRHRLRPGRAHRRAAPEGDPAMSRYYAPKGGLPPQTALMTQRAVFTEAYAVIPRGCFSDIVTSHLPGWRRTRAWMVARPLSALPRPSAST
jgi:hypothetical protein